MSQRYNEKRAKAAEYAMNKELDSGMEQINFDGELRKDVRDAAMGKGDDELFEKKLTKEEKKAKAKAAREAKKAAKIKKGKGSTKKTKPPSAGLSSEEKKEESEIALTDEKDLKESQRERALEELSQNEIVVTYEQKKGNIHANTRDINVSGVTVNFHGKPLIEDTTVVINYGNRYGFIGPNGSGKSTVMKAIAARAIPIPNALDIYFLDSEYPPRTDITALEAVMESNDEIQFLEQKADRLNAAMAECTGDDVVEQQMEIQNQLEMVYDRLDQLDATTAESRATQILFGLGFTTAMQSMKPKEFSGGWRMRIALAKALFLKPEFLLMDEPTNHLDMDAVLWLEEYLSNWDKILFFCVSFSRLYE